MGIFGAWVWHTLHRHQRHCWHHDRITAGTPLTPPRGESWINGVLVDLGRRKMFWCRVCKQRWFV